MKPNISFLLFFVLISANSYAQKEVNWWFFGRGTDKGNSLNFNNTTTVNDNLGRPTTGMPQAGRGKITTREGCFTLSDRNGNLMLYSEGTTIWDKNGAELPNGTGLLGGSSSTQSGIIVPHPGAANKFYAISVAQSEFPTNGGIYYSVVDMILNGGLGDVVSTQKNVYLLAEATNENIAAVKKKGSSNYWIIHRQVADLTGKIYVWELTPEGFSTPAIYTYSTSFLWLDAGYLKFSADGTRFASPIWFGGAILSGEFDPVTGQISNIRIRNAGMSANVYSVEFSISGEHLFITTATGVAENLFHISWNDLRTTTLPAKALNKSVSVIQMHPDGRIYGIEYGMQHLYVIMEPEEGENADVRVFENYLPEIAGMGLPNFAANFMKVEGEPVFCVNTPKEFSVSLNNSSIAYTVWSFGDDSPVITDTDVSTNKQTHSHTYTNPGTYTITVRVFDSDDKLLWQESFDVKVSPCVIPVNPNVHIR